MTTFSVTTNKNWDDNSFSTRAGNDTYNIDGNSRLTIDTDTRYCLNSTGSTGNLAAVNVNAAPYSGNGEVYIDGSKVRIIPFSSSAGNVPAVGTTITEGGVSSALLGVWSAFNVEPSYPGSAMPGTGYIKVKNVTGSYSVGALTGITASATGPDTVGWIEVVGLETALLSVYYKNKFTVRGEWFEHSTLVTTGLSGSTYQLPASLANTYYAGVWVETAVASSVYEFYPSGGTYTGAGSVATDAVRGKVCWISSQGLVRLGYDGTGTNGYLPVSGCRIRVPNIVTVNSTAAAPTVNVAPNAVMATRYETAVTYGPIIDIDKCNFAWYLNIIQPYSLSITNTAILDSFNVQEVKEAFTLTNVGTGLTAAWIQTAVYIQTCRHGGTITDCVFGAGMPTAASGYMAYFYNSTGLTLLRNRIFAFGPRLQTYMYTYMCTYLTNCTITDCIEGGGSFYFNTCIGTTVTNLTYFDNLFGNTNSTTPLTYGAMLFSACTDCTLDGINFGGLFRTAPYAAIVYLANLCLRCTIKNIGTSSTPLNLGGPQVDDATWTRATTTATVTSVAHGLATNDIIYVKVSSSTGAITTVIKTVTRLTDDTFTFVCLNAGAASGTLTYYQVISGYSVFAASAAGSKGTKIQRCYTQHARTTAYPLTLNDYDGWQIDNCWGDGWSPALTPQVNGVNRGMKAGPTLVVQIAAYGTHWIDVFPSELSPSTTAQTWARAAAVCTVTSVGHGLRTGNNIIITASSDWSLFSLPTQWNKVVTVIDSNTFTIVCANAGAASGTLSYTNASWVAMQMNEPSVETQPLVTIVGAPHWMQQGSVALYTAGDQITWEMPDYCIGHTGFSNCPPMTVGVSVQDSLLFDITYQIDKNDGTGYSGWKNMAYARTGGAMTAGQYTITMTDTTGVGVGDYVHVSGYGYIGMLSKVVTVDSPTQITVNVANINTISGQNLWFRQFPNEVLDAQKGFKLKFRIYCKTNNTNTYFNYIGLITTSTVTSRAYQYPLTGLVTASTLWNPFIGDVVNLTPSGSATTYKANIIDNLFPVQDPVSSSLSRYEYRVIYNDITGSVTGTPWKSIWTTVSGYVPTFSALPFVSSSAGNPSSGSILRYVP